MKNPTERLDDLELKISFLEDALEKIDQVVIKQQEHIDALVRQVIALKASSTDGGLAAPRSLRDELPPHF